MVPFRNGRMVTISHVAENTAANSVPSSALMATIFGIGGGGNAAENAFGTGS